ncbi:MAG: rhodanese-like domain-containing protein [Thioalkalivibrionaceae bacterium]
MVGLFLVALVGVIAVALAIGRETDRATARMGAAVQGADAPSNRETSSVAHAGAEDVDSMSGPPAGGVSGAVEVVSAESGAGANSVLDFRLRDRSGRLTATEAFAASRSGELIIVDIRRPEEWSETGVAETAIPISVESHRDGVQGFLRDLEWATGGDRSVPVALICRTGNRTAQLAPQLRQLGYERVFTVDEGMAGSAAGPGWLARGLPLR